MQQKFMRAGKETFKCMVGAMIWIVVVVNFDDDDDGCDDNKAGVGVTGHAVNGTEYLKYLTS